MKKRRQRPSIRAVRTVSETDEIRIVEGLGIPFGGPFAGRDTYGTFASPRTDFHWDLFPDVVPGATRDGDAPGYVRPVTYNHGFDPEVGLARVGGWSPVRTDAEGVWVQAQLDKRAKYYARIAPLLDAEALGFSSGSAEHSVRFDERTGEWLEWPVYELALTPTEANPYAAIAARATAVGATRVSRETPPREPNALRYSSAAWDASAAAWALSSVIDLLGEEADEAEQAQHLRNAIAELQAFIDLELAEVGTPDEQAESAADMTSISESITVTAWASATRGGRDDRTTAATRLGSAHDALAVALDLSCAPGDNAGDDATARSADAPPAFRIVSGPAVRDDAAAERELAAMAESAARDAVARLTG